MSTAKKILQKPYSELTVRELSEHFTELREIHDIDLIVIKGHALLEIAIRHLLASRLCCAEDKLPEMRFELTCQLAFVGTTHSSSRQLCLDLNKIRNQLAHVLAPRDARKKLIDLVRTMNVKGFAWPRDRNEQRYHTALAMAKIAGQVHGVALACRKTIRSPL
ncbi:hypothetical protein ACFL2T_02415 [Elusimicrobiota bacterium]